MQPTLRSLYICYLSLDDPLVETQVVAYLEGLAQEGHTVHLLTFELRLERKRRRALRQDLARRGISWHSVRYHKRPSLPATIYDAIAAAAVAVRLVRKHRLDAVHARNHVPAATALLVRRMTGCRLIFDIRGLMAEQYVDAGSWRRGGIPYRITQWIQASAIRQADGIVMLTERVRRHLFGPQPPAMTRVIPCCADLERLVGADDEGASVRQELEVAQRPVMAYVGKLTGRYMAEEMVHFFAAASRLEPSLMLLVLTQDQPDVLSPALARWKIPESDYRVMRAEPDSIGRYLAIASFGIFLYRSGLSDIAVSPTKVGEYLGAGMPIVSGPGVGDTEALLRDNGVGVIVEDFSDAGFESHGRSILELASDPACRRRCRAVAEENFSLHAVGIPRYSDLYAEVANATAREDGRTP